jgi:hypothetical protein
MRFVHTGKPFVGFLVVADFANKTELEKPHFFAPVRDEGTTTEGFGLGVPTFGLVDREGFFC